jgi:hypothetical protein
MAMFEIASRPRRNTVGPEDPDVYANIDAPFNKGVRPRRVHTESSPSNLPIPLQEIPVDSETALIPPRGRTAESPNQPAQPSFDDASLLSTVVRPRATRPREVDPPQTESERLQRDYNQARQPSYDRNGRVKSAIFHALHQLSEGAHQVLASGRPVDEYGLASVVGRGLGGAFGGTLNPAIDEEYKRKARMADLEQQIANQLKIEQQQAAIEKTRADAEWQQQRPDIEANKNNTARLKRERDAFFARLRIKKGMPLHDDDIQEGKRLGITIDPQQWLNTKSNAFNVTLTDPNDPTRTNTVRFNAVTGEQTVLGQRGFQQPVGADGMTASQRRGHQLREASNEIARERLQVLRDALARGLKQDEAKLAADSYAAEALTSLAEIHENNAEYADDEDERLALIEAARKIREKAVELGGRARGVQSTQPNPSSLKPPASPKSDPLGLFKP